MTVDEIIESTKKLYTIQISVFNHLSKTLLLNFCGCRNAS